MQNMARKIAHGSDHHYVFAGKPGEGALYMAPDNHVLDEAHAAPNWVKVSPFVAMLLGFVVAYWFYIVNTSLPARLAANQHPLYLFLLNKWYFDEIYDADLCQTCFGAWPLPVETREMATQSTAS